MQTLEQKIRAEIARKLVVKITHRKRAKRFVVTVPFFDGKVMSTPTTQPTKAIALSALLIAVRCAPRLEWTIKAVK